VLTFPYQYKKIDFGRLLNPLILLPVKASWGWQYLWFLVDSGADTVMIPIDLAIKLGLAFEASVKTKLYGIGRQEVSAFPGKIVLKIENNEITARAYFVQSQDSVLLLGRLDIFERFSIVFDETKQAVIFK
jgi:hypothetical protein